MTEQEAIEYINSVFDEHFGDRCVSNTNKFAIAQEMAISALEKQITKEPIDKIMYKECPICGAVDLGRYCMECGQKIKLGGEEDKEKLDEIFEEIELYGEPDSASEFMRIFEDNNDGDFCDVWEMVECKYPSNALKIVEVFKDCIQPYIKNLLNEVENNAIKEA